MLELGLNIEHHALPGLYVSFIYNQAGSLIKWFRDTFSERRQDPTKDVFAALGGEMPADPTRLLVLPYFEPTGAPGFLTEVTGLIMGLTMMTKRGDILKALMECETYYFLESLVTLKSLGIDTTHFVATGGGSKSDHWLKIKADIFGVPYERCATSEAGTLGAAMIAATAVGVTASHSEAVDLFVRPGPLFEPDRERHAFYEEKYLQYRELYPRLRDIISWTGRQA
jgi:xylulokinase